MVPGISAEDCLFADLGVDPASEGCQSFDATDFLVYRREFDPTCSLILWQISVIGETSYKLTACNMGGLRLLIDALQQYYEPTHETVVYEAAGYAASEPRTERVPLAKLADAAVTPASTLYVPSLPRRPPDLEIARRLGIPRRSQALLRSGQGQ
jgi:hypothetical protein